MNKRRSNGARGPRRKLTWTDPSQRPDRAGSDLQTGCRGPSFSTLCTPPSGIDPPALLVRLFTASTRGPEFPLCWLRGLNEVNGSHFLNELWSPAWTQSIDPPTHGWSFYDLYVWPLLMLLFDPLSMGY